MSNSIAVEANEIKRIGLGCKHSGSGSGQGKAAMISRTQMVAIVYNSSNTFLVSYELGSKEFKTIINKL